MLSTFVSKKRSIFEFLNHSEENSIRFSKLLILPDIAYGRPHLEYWGYLPFSKIVICAFLSVFLANCADVPPAAPQPIITISLSWFR